MISINEVIEIHSVLIEKFGGSMGIRDLKLLESAILRPSLSEFKAIDWGSLTDIFPL